MEFLIAAVIILILLLILGVSPFAMMLGVLWLMEVVLAAMSLFFLVSVILLLIGRTCTGRFVRIDEHGKFRTAVYVSDGEEIPNLYPAETLLRRWIYTERPHHLRLFRMGKRTFLFDMHSTVIAALGLPLSVIGAGLLGWMLTKVM